MKQAHSAAGHVLQEGRPMRDEEDEYLTEQAIDEELHRKLEKIDSEIKQRQKSLGRWALVAIFTTLLLGGSIWRDHHLNQQVQSNSPAGQLLDLRPVRQPKGFWPMVLVVQTSTGFYSLREPLSLSLGAAMVREERESSRQYLCDQERTQCAEVARASRP
jgi:hypothetical protein